MVCSPSSPSAADRNPPPPPPPPPPPKPHREKHLVRNLADACSLKFSDRKTYDEMKSLGMVELDSTLVLKYGLQIFRGERSKGAIKHQVFKTNRTHYETPEGKVCCEATDNVYARIIDERIDPTREINPAVANLSSDGNKGNLMEVVLFNYRHNMLDHGLKALPYLEHVLALMRRSIHDFVVEGTEVSDAVGMESTVPPWSTRSNKCLMLGAQALPTRERA